jgi:hypothetical protein
VCYSLPDCARTLTALADTPTSSGSLYGFPKSFYKLSYEVMPGFRRSTRW